jgi:hypothetical protein
LERPTDLDLRSQSRVARALVAGAGNRGGWRRSGRAAVAKQRPRPARGDWR